MNKPIDEMVVKVRVVVVVNVLKDDDVLNEFYDLDLNLTNVNWDENENQSCRLK